MSYSIYIGIVEEMEQAKEIISFSKSLHYDTFKLLKGSELKWGRLSELKDYDEFVILHTVID